MSALPTGPDLRLHLPLISVVIPAYNAQAHLAQGLASVTSQTGAFRLETLVVDDGSRDDTAAIARAHPGVQCLTQVNRGPSAARNAGIAATTGELIAFLDADDLWPAGKLQAQLDLLIRHREAALVFGDCRQFNMRGPWPRSEFSAGGFGARSWGDSQLVPQAYARLLTDNFITTGSVVVRRAALDQIGGFAEDLRLVEDLDLWLRIARHFPIAWCGQECLHRRRHDSNTSLDSKAVALAYLDVLARHVAGWAAGDEAMLGVDAGQLRSAAELHLAELSMAKGQTSDTFRHIARSVAASPKPTNAWRATKTLVKLGARGLGVRR